MNQMFLSGPKVASPEDAVAPRFSCCRARTESAGAVAVGRVDVQAKRVDLSQEQP